MINPDLLLKDNLLLPRCPHCLIDSPNLSKVTDFNTADYKKSNGRIWYVYKCAKCGGAVLAGRSSVGGNDTVREYYPMLKNTLSEAIPIEPRDFLTQCRDTIIIAPSGSIMLAASAVDSMLKVKGYIDGKLYGRINQANKDHLITDGMKQWADQVRLNANEQRHADSKFVPPTSDDAQLAYEFAIALAEFLFVLPAKVNKGITDSKPKN